MAHLKKNFIGLIFIVANGILKNNLTNGHTARIDRKEPKTEWEPFFSKS